MTGCLVQIHLLNIFCSIMSEKEPEDYHFPSTLEDFGYHFNHEGKLRNKETDEKFLFNVKEGDHRYNQKHYEALGNIITEHIYKLLEEDYKLKRITIPVDAVEDEPATFFYASDDALTNPDKLLVLIHGSGAVRAGQWARSLIINDCLDSGTQFPYIKWGMENNYGIIVANTNVNEATVNGQEVEIRGSESPEMHTESIWKDFVHTAKAKQIAIVAHSYGGVCTLELAINFTDEFKDRVFAIALTDSVHSLGHQEASEDVIEFYKERARNWASSYDPLDTPLETKMDRCPTVSAGTDKHEYTSYSCMHSVFKFFDEKYQERYSRLSEEKESVKTDSKAADGDNISEKPTIEKTDISKGDNSAMSQNVLSQEDEDMASQSQDMLSQGDTHMASQDMLSQADTHMASQDVTISAEKEEL